MFSGSISFRPSPLGTITRVQMNIRVYMHT